MNCVHCVHSISSSSSHFLLRAIDGMCVFQWIPFRIMGIYVFYLYTMCNYFDDNWSWVRESKRKRDEKTGCNTHTVALRIHIPTEKRSYVLCFFSLLCLVAKRHRRRRQQRLRWRWRCVCARKKESEFKINSSESYISSPRATVNWLAAIVSEGPCFSFANRKHTRTHFNVDVRTYLPFHIGFRTPLALVRPKPFSSCANYRASINFTCTRCAKEWKRTAEWQRKRQRERE